jgi:hypothetical protein
MGVSRLVNTAGPGFVVQQTCERRNASAFTLKAFTNSSPNLHRNREYNNIQQRGVATDGVKNCIWLLS